MKKLGLALAAALAGAGLGWAQVPPETVPPAAETKPAAKSKTHKFRAEVVSTDVDKKTITVKVDGAEKTAPVGPLAMGRLKMLKAGDRILLTCLDDAATGEHKEVSFIRMAPLAAVAPAAPAEKK